MSQDGKARKVLEEALTETHQTDMRKKSLVDAYCDKCCIPLCVAGHANVTDLDDDGGYCHRCANLYRKAVGASLIAH